MKQLFPNLRLRRLSFEYPGSAGAGPRHPTMAREQRRARPRHSHGDPTSLAPHERLTDLTVVPREKAHTGPPLENNPETPPSSRVEGLRLLFARIEPQPSDEAPHPPCASRFVQIRTLVIRAGSHTNLADRRSQCARRLGTSQQSRWGSSTPAVNPSATTCVHQHCIISAHTRAPPRKHRYFCTPGVSLWKLSWQEQPIPYL